MTPPSGLSPTPREPPDLQAIEDAWILVVDDDDTTVAFITKALQRAGYRHVIGTTDPRSVIETEHQLPDLILLDLSMPVLDGFGFMAQLRDWDWPHGLPLVIVITAHNERDLRLRALDAGAIDYIGKPIDLRELLLRVRNHLLNRALQQRLAANEARLGALLDEARQGNRAKDLFLANISHELRTPLTAIIGFTETLAEDPAIGAPQHETVEIVLRNVRHLHALVSDLLDISKLQVGHLHTEQRDVMLCDCLQGALQLARGQAARKGLAFRFHPLPPLPSQIHTDPTRFTQILINLLSNAIKFTERGDVYLFLSWDPDHRRLVMTVQDSGPGIPNDALPTIFDPFTQADSSSGRQHGGSGLGLAIAKGLAEQLGGTIEVSSHPGRGSVFIALIDPGPIAADHLLDDPNAWQCDGGETAPTVPVPRLAGTVLVAEDTPDTQRLVSFYLQRAGARTILARNGEEAIWQAQQNADIDLVLMDMHMPDIDGLEATEILRLTGFDRPIVALTADVTASTRRAAREAGCMAVLTKPIDLRAFYDLLTRCLRPADATHLKAPDQADDTQIMAELRAEFEAALPERIADLRRAFADGDLGALRRLAHQLRGIGTSFGHPEITELAGTLENAADRTDTPVIARCLHALEQTPWPDISN